MILWSFSSLPQKCWQSHFFTTIYLVLLTGYNKTGPITGIILIWYDMVQQYNSKILSRIIKHFIMIHNQSLLKVKSNIMSTCLFRLAIDESCWQEALYLCLGHLWHISFWKSLGESFWKENLWTGTNIVTAFELSK